MNRHFADWKAKVSWFASEYIIVVAGVLTAMALASWAGRRQELAREQEYLHQLDADLARTEAIVAKADSAGMRVDPSGALFVRAFLAADRPSPDSLAAWLVRASSWTNPHPILGTADALIASGDLRLISIDSLRSQITEYVEYARQLVDEHQLFLNVWREGYSSVLAVVDNSELAISVRTQAQIDSAATENPRSGIPAGKRRHPFPVDWDAILNNQRVYQGAQRMNVAKSNLAGIRRNMRTAAERLRSTIANAQESRSNN